MKISISPYGIILGTTFNYITFSLDIEFTSTENHKRPFTPTAVHIIHNIQYAIKYWTNYDTPTSFK